MKKQLYIVRGFNSSCREFTAKAIVHYTDSCRLETPHLGTTTVLCTAEVKAGVDVKVAHRQCMASVRKALEDSTIDVIVVHNPFIRLMQMYPYFRMAREYDAEVHVIESFVSHSTISAKEGKEWESYRPVFGNPAEHDPTI